MTQRRPELRAGDPSPIAEPRPDPLGRIGPYAITTSLLRDAGGEVCAATGPSGEVRIRLVPSGDIELSERLAAAAAALHPAVAPILERLPAGERLALVGAPDRLTLADRRRRGRLDAAAAVATGATLLEGLAALHAAGSAHGGVAAALVGIDASGHPRWRDAGLCEPASAGDDLVRFAGVALDAGGLPPALATALDEIATGAASPPSAAALLVTWRELAAAEGLAVPPPGVAVRAAALLAPPPRRRRPVPRPVRRGVAALALVAAAGVWPAARLGPGGAAPFDGVASYAPSHAGQRLEYRYERSTSAGAAAASVTLRVTTAAVVAGVETVELVPDTTAGAAAGSGPTLPFGLGGGTIRVEGDALERAADGGTVRDLQGPLAPGATWSDARTSAAGFTTTETRSVLGPAAITVAAGRFDRCVVVALRAVVTSAGSGPQTAAAGDAWYCAGVGLARALLTSTLSESDAIELSSVG